MKYLVIQIFVAITTLYILGSDMLSAETRPNILFCISDDQSYAHTGANGDPVDDRYAPYYRDKGCSENIAACFSHNETTHF